MKLKPFTFITLILFASFGLLQGHQSFKEIQQFNQRFAQTNFEIAANKNAETKAESAITEGQDQDKQSNLADKQVAQQNDSLKKAETQIDVAYQLTDKDPLMHLNDEVKNSKVFEELSNFSRDELELVMKTKDRAELAKMSIQVINQLQACLTDGRCVEEVDLNSEYFRQGHTRAHQLLERSLHTLIILQEEDETLRNAMSFENKLSILDLNNSEIQRLGLELLGTQELDAKQVSSILAKDNRLDQEAQGALFTQVERYTRTEPELREKYLAHLKRQFESDPAAAIEILKVLPFAKLEESEIAQVSRGLCQHKNNGASQNWQAIEMHHSLYQDSQGLSTRLSSLCSAQ